MDQWRQLRLDGAGPAKVTILGPAERQMAGCTVQFPGEGLRLILAEPLAPGSALRVEWEDAEVLGEVFCCERREDGYAVGVTIEHALAGTRELARLASHLLGEEKPDSVRTPER